MIKKPYSAKKPCSASVVQLGEMPFRLSIFNFNCSFSGILCKIQHRPTSDMISQAANMPLGKSMQCTGLISGFSRELI